MGTTNEDQAVIEFDKELVCALGERSIRLSNEAKRLRAELAAAKAERDAAKGEKTGPEYWEHRREGFHATYNGGHHKDAERSAFHHGMDTVFNSLAAEAKAATPTPPPADGETIVTSCQINRNNHPNAETAELRRLPGIHSIGFCSVVHNGEGWCIDGNVGKQSPAQVAELEGPIGSLVNFLKSRGEDNADRRPVGRVIGVVKSLDATIADLREQVETLTKEADSTIDLMLENDDLADHRGGSDCANSVAALGGVAMQLHLKLATAVADTASWKDRAEKLWQILDNISTSSDAIKPSSLNGYAAFYEATMTRVEKRSAILSSDGYTLSVPEAPTPPPAEGDSLAGPLSRMGYENRINKLTAQVAELEQEKANYTAVALQGVEKDRARDHATIADLREQLKHAEDHRADNWNAKLTAERERDALRERESKIYQSVREDGHHGPRSIQQLVKLKIGGLVDRLATAERERDEAKGGVSILNTRIGEVEMDRRRISGELQVAHADTARLVAKIVEIDNEDYKSIVFRREIRKYLGGDGRIPIQVGVLPPLEASTAATNEQQADAGAGEEGEEWTNDDRQALGLLRKHIPGTNPTPDAGESDNKEGVCDKCGGKNVVWFVASELWNKYAGDPNILCPICFVEAADRGGCKATGWELVPENVDAGKRVEPDDGLTAAYLRGVADEQAKQPDSVAERIEAVVDWVFDHCDCVHKGYLKLDRIPKYEFVSVEVMKAAVKQNRVGEALESAEAMQQKNEVNDDH